VNVLAIERRHERLVQLPQDVVRDRVAEMLEVLDLVGSRRRVVEMFQHLDHGNRARLDVFRLLIEHLKERLLAWENSAQESGHEPIRLRELECYRKMNTLYQSSQLGKKGLPARRGAVCHPRRRGLTSQNPVSKPDIDELIDSTDDRNPGPVTPRFWALPLLGHGLGLKIEKRAG
jgi:hypothetical protein